jgi:hypothetical protein
MYICTHTQVLKLSDAQAGLVHNNYTNTLSKQGEKESGVFHLINTTASVKLTALYRVSAVLAVQSELHYTERPAVLAVQSEPPYTECPALLSAQ